MLSILTVLLSAMVMASALSPKQFKDIYDAHVGLVQFVLRKFNLPQQEIEEIVQEVFLKLFQMKAPLEPSTLKAFLTTIARNKAMDALRRRTRQKTDLAGEAMEDGASELWKSDPRRILEAQVVAEFLEEMQDEPGAEILIQFYKDGLTVREIAAIRQEPVSNITSRLSRARNRFKLHLKNRLDTLIGHEEW